MLLFNATIYWGRTTSRARNLDMNCSKTTYLREFKRQVGEHHKNVSKAMTAIDCMAQVAYILPIDFPMRPKLMHATNKRTWPVSKYNELIENITYNMGAIAIEGGILHRIQDLEVSAKFHPCKTSIKSFREKEFLLLMKALIKFRHQYACFKETIAFITQQLKELEKIKLKIVNDIIDAKTTPILYLNTPNYDGKDNNQGPYCATMSNSAVMRPPIINFDVELCPEFTNKLVAIAMIVGGILDDAGE
ncbi:hypothetical protein TrispH2_012010 [Trichoplax sp. H2]|nr:hypothetical protein TrispH2_012010 [Trichoplax sp. H2]|eukprot:RDD36095.1 hypothetical protein TrispH2_012010 [Trichoplax sp. H2]